MKLAVLITAEQEKGLDVALAWREAGAPGVTILRAFGLNTLKNQIGTFELPRMVSSMAAAMAAILEQAEPEGHLIFSLVDDNLVPRMIAEATRIMGDLTQPHHGVFFVVPIDLAIGVIDHRTQERNI